MQAGTMLAHYRVEEKIGAGGMGEVYRAEDTVLGRDVALKILPPEFAADGDRLARFGREAKVLASLHHPNIASIFGFETLDECTFLVMEMVEGEDLSEVVRRGAVPVDDAVDIARQIAEGLEEAHENGIVHRDLKPANVKRTPEGRVKILDFGLARAFSGQTLAEEDLSSAATMTQAMTQAGTVLGTAAYMSPEQARGKEVDRRADIWAFGVILFEMLSGERLFAGETASDTLAEILKTEPEWEKLPAGLPPQVERVLRRCLTKDPRQRLRDIGEARVRLEDPQAESGVFTGPVTPLDLPAERRRGVLPWALLAVSLAAVAWLALTRGGETTPSLDYHLAIPAPEGAEFLVGGSYPGLPVVSPDGRLVVYSARSEDDGSVQLYVRALDAGTSVALDGTRDAQYPFWSPDSEWVAFYDRNEGLKRIRAVGGPTQVICAAGNGKGGSWSVDNEIIFTTDYNTSIQVVAAVGGEPRPVTDVEGDADVDSHRHPQFLPDGRHFLYLARGTGGKATEIRLASLDGGPHRVVMNTDIAPQYASGHLLFMNKQTLMAQAFDPGAGTLTGAPVPVASDVMIIAGAAKAAFAASREGTLVYLRGDANNESSVVWLDRAGNIQGQVGDLSTFSSLVLSPEGRRAAVEIMDYQAGTSDIWILDIERNFRRRLTTHPADDAYAVWHPDGRSIFFASDRSGHYVVMRKDLDGTGEAEVVIDGGTATLPWDCADGGRTLLYSVEGQNAGWDLWAADPAGGDEPRLLRASRANDGAARISRDNAWISFWSEESGEGQVYLAPWPEMKPVSQVSPTSGTWSHWRADGRELVYQEGNGRYMSVGLTPEGRDMRIGVPVELFDYIAAKFEGPWLDMMADGERFLAVRSADAEPPEFCEVVVNWPARIAPD